MKVLIVEDEVMIADMLEDALRADGFGVCGVATNIQGALALATEHRPDLAIVDVRLDGNDLGTNLAARLSRLYRIGILYATGNSDLVICEGVVGDGYMKKPYRMRDVCGALYVIHEIMQTGRTTRSKPDTLILLPSGTER